MSKCQCCGCDCSCQCSCHGQPRGGGAGGGPGKPGGGGTGGAGGGGGLPGPVPQLGTWLLIRYDSADLGARPIPGSDVFWESPDIWLTGGDQYGNPVGGHPANVFARVWNLGSIMAAPVRVDFFFIAPSLGIPPSAPELIGTAWTTVGPLSATNVACPVPWVPPVTKGNLHACLLATCSALLQGDVPTVPANPVADRHTGQRNLTVLEAGSGAEIPVHLRLVNLAPASSLVQVMAAGSWRADAAVAANRFPARPSLIGPINAVRVASPADNRLWAQRAALIVERSAHTAEHILPSKGIHDALKLTGLKAGHITRSSAIVAPSNRFDVASANFTALGDAIELKALQEATATLSITVPKAARQPWFVVHLAQVVNGSVVGGYTVAIGAD
ncbi:MAG: hypothetical protein ACRD1N_08730 [Terriglobia bacterium]